MCEKMRMLLGSAAGRFPASHSSILLLLLVSLPHGVILSQCASTTVAATRIHVAEMELQRSLARYRQLLQHENSRPDLVKPQESDVEEDPKNDADIINQVVQGFELEMDDKAELKENSDPVLEMSESKKVDHDTKVDPNKDIDARKSKQKKKKKINKDKEQSETEQQDNTEELELITMEQIDENVADEVRTEETNKGEEPELDNVGKAVEETVEEQGVKVDKIEQETKPNVETQQLEEEKVEPEGTSGTQQTERDGHYNAEENNSEERNKSESQIQEESKDSDSKIQVGSSEEGKESEPKTAEQKTEDKQEHSADSTIAEEKPVEEEPFVFPEPYLLGVPIKDWDEQRGSWLDANPQWKTTSDGKPRVLIVTGSQPGPCRNPVGDDFHVKSLKLKIDYARMHNYEIYYSFAWLDPSFGSYWVKLPLLRNLMLTHPEIEWFFWIDSDAIFTDMIFEAPFHTYEGINMLMWGYRNGIFVEKSWVAFNAGVFIIRNCQWSLDLIDKWSPMGRYGRANVEYGKMLTAFLSNRAENYPADDQSALAYLIITDDAVKSKVKLVEYSEYMISAWWVIVVDTYEMLMEKYHPGLGDERWPWITHFTGCGPCGSDGTSDNHEKCMTNMARALNFAHNQVLAYMGFQHESLSSQSLIRTRNESDRPLEVLGVNPWQERIAQVAAGAGHSLS